MQLPLEWRKLVRNGMLFTSPKMGLKLSENLDGEILRKETRELQMQGCSLWGVMLCSMFAFNFIP
jgi:hypothetical protein